MGERNTVFRGTKPHILLRWMPPDVSQLSAGSMTGRWGIQVHPGGKFVGAHHQR